MSGIIDIYVTTTPNRALCEGYSEEGVEFVDAFIAAILNVPDSGSIIISINDLPRFLQEAAERDLTIKAQEEAG